MRDVSGSCKHVCMQLANAKGQLKPTDPRVCEMGADMAYWRDACDVTFNCAVDKEFSIDKPGLAYKADHYRIIVKSIFTPAQKPLTEAINSLASQVGPGDLVMFFALRSWKFKDESWDGLSAPDSDSNVPKLIKKNDACHKLVQELTEKQKQ